MERAFNHSIRKAIDFLYNYTLLSHSGPIISLNPNPAFLQISRDSAKYSDIYDSGIEQGSYNCILFDQSFFQFTLQSDDIRLAYYPNPYQFIEYLKFKEDVDELLENGEISLEELDILLCEETFYMDIPPIRYDYSKSQYCNKHHPTAHFHVGLFSENRWATNRILFPFPFLLFILKTYYIDKWKAHGDKDESNLFNDLFEQELCECHSIPSDYFSSSERKRLYLT